MIQFIVGITLIALLIEFPSVLFTALIIGGAVYLYCKHPDSLGKLGIRIPTEYKTGEKEEDLPAEKKDFETAEERMKRAEEEIEQKMKPGYKDDPKWQAGTDRLRRYVEKNQEIAEQEEKLEMLKEAEQHALAGEWNKVEAIERKIREMAAKS